MVQSVNAWVLRDSSGAAVAVAEVEMVEYLTTAEFLPVPLTPAYCPVVMPWRDRLLPVVHLGRLLGTEGVGDSVHHIGVLAYQLRSGEPLQHLALALAQAPNRVSVGEQPSAALPEKYNGALQPLVRSVFTHGEEEIAVLDVAYLASAALRDRLGDN